MKKVVLTNALSRSKKLGQKPGVSRRRMSPFPHVVHAHSKVFVFPRVDKPPYTQINISEFILNMYASHKAHGTFANKMQLKHCYKFICAKSNQRHKPSCK